jgi:hypothetical protein
MGLFGVATGFPGMMIRNVGIVAMRLLGFVPPQLKNLVYVESISFLLQKIINC